MEQYFQYYSSLEEQRWMVADKSRTDAFAKAIKEVVKPGDVVIDIGAGTGLLSILAAQAGAKRVIAIERSNMARFARDLIKKNEFDHIIEVFNGDAADLQLEGKADVIVSEWLGHFAYVEGMFPTVLQVRDRWLRPGGHMIPATVDLVLAPMSDLELYHKYGPGFWNKEKVHGIDYSDFMKEELDQGLANQLNIRQEALLSPGEIIHQLDTHTARPGEEWSKGQQEFVISKDAQLTALVGWFNLGLSSQTSLDTAPSAPLTHWVQTYFPFEAVDVKAVEKLVVNFSIDEAHEGARLMEVIFRIHEKEIRYVVR